jgi:hypothetical protein
LSSILKLQKVFKQKIFEKTKNQLKKTEFKILIVDIFDVLCLKYDLALKVGVWQAA